MAEDKIVLKKTAPKAAVVKKTAARKEPKTAAPPAATAPAPSQRRAAETEDAGAPARVRTTRKRPMPANPAETKQQDDQQDLLRQLATVSDEQRLAMIREAAYYKAEKRQFAPGHEAEDWAAAEREIDELIARAKLMTGL
ncbi:DUF2934 domain-containing protein [Caldichromatium japonicum]|uniref:DUF2934 domain-containing protein n=1 Tax=Caldichromatium japonicum TaxID=2699430 RepID=A0A6G7VCJ4_9GAMM|nr:DUF2934 domain-containing protein [Caldichromatium japonicum]QIK37779.1 DUF2934 domain-containing protein [Caldichromatium japonicum]